MLSVFGFNRTIIELKLRMYDLSWITIIEVLIVLL